MKNRYRYSLIIITILLLITTSIGSSYSLWTVTQAFEPEEVLVGFSCFELDTTNSTVTLQEYNMIPFSDEKGALTSPAVIRVTNNCNQAIPFQLLLATVNYKGNPINENYMRFSLTGAKTITPTNLSGLSTIPNYTIPNQNVINTYVITTDNINPNETKNYSFRTWIKDSNLNVTTLQDGTIVEGYDLMDKRFNAILVVEANSTLY